MTLGSYRGVGDGGWPECMVWRGERITEHQGKGESQDQIKR